MRAVAWLLCTLALVGQAHADADPSAAADTPCRDVADVEEVYPRVDLNRADESALVGLPGIGEARARAIVAWRSAHGGFRNLSQLLQVKGIGRALLKRLRPLVTL
ncbi:MAG: helix-hairpin-helix domain-containing protein [Polyangiales bacterium]